MQKENKERTLAPLHLVSFFLGDRVFLLINKDFYSFFKKNLNIDFILIDQQY